MSNKRRHVTFSTDFPKVEDFAYRNGIFEDQVVRRSLDVFHQKGVVKGFLNELEVYTDDPSDPTKVLVKTGAAWILGERTPVTAVTEVPLDVGVLTAPRSIRITHTEAQNADEHSQRPRVAGPDGVVWYDDAAVFVDKDAEAAVETNELVLAAVGWTGTELVITDYRTWVRLIAPLQTGSVTADAIANLAITNGKLANKVVNTGKIADNGVGEINLAAGTDIVPLHQDCRVERAAGDGVDPSSEVAGEFHCQIGGGYLYKIFGRVLRMIGIDKGPVRRLRLVCEVEAPGTGEGVIYLVAWLDGDPPGSFDPEDPSFDAIEAHTTVHGPANPYSAEIPLDVSVLSTSRDARIVYGIVMINNTSQVMTMRKVTLVALR